MLFHELYDEEYASFIENQSDAEEALSGSKGKDDFLDFVEVKENILTTIANSRDLDDLNKNFILARQRLNYAKNVMGRIKKNEEDLIFDLAKKLYNLIYNKMNNID